MLKEEVLLLLVFILQLCIVFHCIVAKRVETEIWIKEQAGRSLARSASLFIRPVPVHENRVLFITFVE